jgi:ElaA protein
MEKEPRYRIECRTFSALRGDEMYRLLSLRQEVFIVEQKCIFQDIDDHDQHALHLLAWHGESTLVGCARLFAPGAHYPEASFGRLVTAPQARRTGLGRELVAAALATISERFGAATVRINAQSYLRRFYEDFGFEVTRGPYDEDGIAHYEMRRLPKTQDAHAAPRHSID